MGFMDKMKAAADTVKDKAAQIKEENKNLGATTKRINNRAAYLGNVNRDVKDGDFWEGSYINTDGAGFVIYSSKDDDYLLNGDDITGIEFAGNGKAIAVGDQQVKSTRYMVTLKDGKKFQADIRMDMDAEFHRFAGK